MSDNVNPIVEAPALQEGSALAVARKILRDLIRSPVAAVALVVTVAICLVAVFAPFIVPQNPYDLQQLSVLDGLQPPGGAPMMGGYTFILGSDSQGRDMYSAIVYGLRISLLVGLASAVFAALVGASLGLIAAYAGGRTETAIMRLVDLQLSFPTILVALMILAFLGKGVGNVILALIIVEWATFARTARAAALVEIRKEYIAAAETMALSHWRILTRHLLPNCIPPLIVIVTMLVARAISLEATLSFLGVGVPITEPSLGLLISNGYEYMFAGHYWLSIFPGIALLVTILSINLVGDRLREILNPQNNA
ncbi:ABC transporter permease [Paracoccus yeei]|uniref:ABC transporter permease n=1 Tax=Paracoccus yeei TaxID=147645 RepID=UPI00048D742B|nr:ABC transporter permease [Paracoccus yeei]